MTKSTEKEKVIMGDEIKLFPLSNLFLDGGNPRLGIQTLDLENQIEILDTIVDQFGVDELLSSIAVNGYFSAEPLVGKPYPSEPEKIIVAEGNRRLAACLILSGDERAKNHPKRTARYQKMQSDHERPLIHKVPVIVKEEGELLAYLGVRHIAASQPWDSYAKAAWVVKILESNDLKLRDISEMIGDKHQTISRMLEGFYFMKQLEDTSQYTPSDSERKGRGSNTTYPFSWVYTILGYQNVRTWLDLPDKTQDVLQEPIKQDKLADARDLIQFLFGKKSESIRPALSDSRQITKLARVINNPEARVRLRNGDTIDKVEEYLRPSHERAATALSTAYDSLQSVISLVNDGSINQDQANRLSQSSQKVKRLAVETTKKIISIAIGNSEDDEE